MLLPDDSTRTIATTTIVFAHPPAHYQPLKEAIPQWLGNASSARLEALKRARPVLPARLKSAAAPHHAELKRLNTAYWSAQNHCEQILKNIQDAHAFAEPLLKNALKARFGVEVDVRRVFLRLYIPATIPWFPVKSGAARSWTVSLLDAALHNFEEQETRSDAYEPASTFITEPTSTGRFDTLPQIKHSIPIPDFTALCRELDIGARFRTYLEENLGISNPVVAARLHPRIEASQKAALKAALQLARMKGDIRDDFSRQLQRLADGSRDIRLDGQPLLCHDLTIMSAKLTGILLFAANLEQSRSAARVVAYIPDDPEHPFKEYASTGELMQTLTRQLRLPAYQTFFSRFVAHEDRGYFFANLADRLAKVTWHQHTRGDPLPSWRETPVDRPDLQFAVTTITRTPWLHLYHEKLNKILNDARMVAVATASVDQKARWALWDSFSSVASTIVQMAAFIALPFVPFLGELMLAYMAYQLVDEAFEGVIDWAEGLTDGAFQHLMAVTQSLVELGTFAAGATVGAGEFRRMLPKEALKFIDTFKPVKAANGKTLYWKPDLTTYEYPTALPASSVPDASGLYEHSAKTLVTIDGKPFAIAQDSQIGAHRIAHPSRPDAYRPILKHNGSGAWQTEIDQPLAWDRKTLLRRLGHLADNLSAADQDRALKASGYHENILRKMHVEHESVPPLLADTLKRFNIDRNLQTFIDRLSSPYREHYVKADSETQLQLLVKHFLWPENKGIRLIDKQGQTVWETAHPASSTIEIEQDRLTDGDLLATLLGNLTETEQHTLLEEEINAPTRSTAARASQLRQTLAQTAARQRTLLFDSRYQTLEHTNNARIQKLLDATFGLPLSVAQELMSEASGAELQQIDNGAVPPRLTELARSAMQEVRGTRAYEGMNLLSLDNPDTDLLMFHSAERLPGWSGEVRIDIQDYTYNGRHRTSIGQQDAPTRKILVQREDRLYAAYDDKGQALSGATDLYDAMLKALPDSERAALKIHAGQGEKLKQALRNHPLKRDELHTLLKQNPQLKPVYDPQIMRLLGGADGYERLPPDAANLDRRVRELFPALSPQEVLSIIRQLNEHPTGADAELSRLQGEYAQLNQDLDAWTHQIHQAPPQQMMEIRQNRIAFKAQMTRTWRQQITVDTTQALTENYDCLLSFSRPLMGELPTVSADFSRVSTLSLQDIGVPHGINGFLQQFSGLTRLELRNVTLGELPSAISMMPELNELLLSDCGIRLTPDTQTALSSLSKLVTLDLYNNPLGLTPNLQGMPDLTYLDLSNTGITRIPQGLRDHPNLHTMILNDNQITDLEPGHYHLPLTLISGTDLSNNPLSLATREQIKAFFGTSGQDFGVMAQAAEIDRTQELYPLMDREEASDFIYKLPGNLEAGRVEVTRLATEYTKLRNDLAAWTSDTPAVHPLTDLPFTDEQLTEEHFSRDAFKEIVEQCWRRESDLEGVNQDGQAHYELYSDEIIHGSLPTLTADFSHVSRLHLEGDENVTSGVEGFLRCFPNLKSLSINDYALNTIPQQVFNLGELTSLELADCLITLDSNTQAALAGMDNIEVLVLSSNPLGLPADVSQMPKLRTLLMFDTDITELPPGLFSRTALLVANLSDNAITEIPSDVLEASVEVTHAINLQGNPISAASMRRLIAYFQRTGEDFGIEEIIETAEMENSSSEGSEVDE
ncbi:dermonecrotic toxin domain-containing protein [Pseudomonas sp. NPDC087697]|uniref:dermonecrotic toxin domain-containing protein n=1 Tax=Pseudomonas sp. NPDC087697 TaxID=3364447 RepID=UPI0038157A7B